MDIRERARKIRLFLMDVDGVLTDGRLYYTSQGEEIKVFHVRDGMGIKLAQRAGLKVGALSGRKSEALKRRLEELGFDEVHLGYNEKLPIVQSISERLCIKLEEFAYLGDDLVDIPVLKRVGFPMCVADAPQEVKKYSLYTTEIKGGYGAVREAVEFLLRIRGDWEELLNHYLC
ncbi:MAG: 3-deoxy-D-manno-octulosonate 8-phosphate phosphatase [Acidobacteria bacterium]|jgi:3-deoxy-D-manno-octulosonate 8-phosphate phosphatase (KDO 8-P phosphatase)|nr:MAG: 3-deoxy-D-manno-octulosonate 8-phosphate phosphatase [Acidobacteriota bacterium]